MVLKGNMNKGGVEMYKRTDDFKLFSKGSLGDFLSAKIENIKSQIEELTDKKILELHEGKVVDLYYKEYHLQPLEIDTKNAKKDLHEKKVSGADFPSARYSHGLDPKKLYPVKVAVYCLPFTGNSDLFYYLPSKRSMAPFDYYKEKTFICFEIEVFSKDAKTVKRESSSIVSNLMKQIEYTNNEVEQYNNDLRDTIKDIFESRKDRAIENKKFLEEL